jgi:Skp family chaperone for outer membrane proteins
LGAVEQKAVLRNREIEATREKALGRIAMEMQPLVAQAYAAHGCGLLIDRGLVLGGNMTNDLTPAIVAGLDARLTTISFDRVNLSPTDAAAPGPR